jgi:hypothetical protein
MAVVMAMTGAAEEPRSARGRPHAHHGPLWLVLLLLLLLLRCCATTGRRRRRRAAVAGCWLAAGWLAN